MLISANLAVFVPSILGYLKGKSLQAKNPSDLLFFDWILKSCAVLEDLPSAINGLELFLHSKNRELLDGYKAASFLLVHIIALSIISFEKMMCSNNCDIFQQ